MLVLTAILLPSFFSLLLVFIGVCKFKNYYESVIVAIIIDVTNPIVHIPHIYFPSALIVAVLIGCVEIIRGKLYLRQRVV